MTLASLTVGATAQVRPWDSRSGLPRRGASAQVSRRDDSTVGPEQGARANPAGAARLFGDHDHARAPVQERNRGALRRFVDLYAGRRRF